MLTRTMRRSVALAPLRFTVAPLSAWANIPLAPPDKILGLNEAFKGDPAPFKVNLGVGAYRDDEGKPYVLPSIKEAEKRVMENYNDHEYAGIAGVQSFLDLSIAFALGSDSAALKEGRVASVQAISGTGACRIVGEFWARFFGKVRTCLCLFQPVHLLGTPSACPSTNFFSSIMHSISLLLLYSNLLF